MEYCMKNMKYLLLSMTFGLMSANVNAQLIDLGQHTIFDRQLGSRDDQSVREFVESKENIDIQNKAKNLEISGDVRFEWRNIQEKGLVYCYDYYDSSYFPSDYVPSVHENYRNFRGGNNVDGKGVPISVNDFDVEFNLKFKYTYKDAYAKAHLQFDNPAGIKGRADKIDPYPIFNRNGNLVLGDRARNTKFCVKGSGDGIFFTLKRAFIGYKAYADGTNRLDFQIGRQKMDDIFDSEIEFTSRFDGILARFARSEEDLFDWYITAGTFVIDERVNHFGYAFELGFLDIYDTGLDLRYNFIDWQKRGKNRNFVWNPWGMQFQNSQWTFAYTISREILGKELPFEFYGGFLINHAAKKREMTHWKKKNLGWYAGLIIGNVERKGNWSLDLEYVAIQAQAVPEYDVGCIGRGNIMDENFDDIVSGSYPYSYGSYGEPYPYSSYYPSSSSSSGFVGYMPARGNGNFIGGRIDFLYAFTDNLTFDIEYETSVAEDDHIGGPHNYHAFEIETIYAW